jgi:uncharacterized membrane protein
VVLEHGGYRQARQAKEAVVGIGVSVFLMALGAILTWGITVDSTEGFNIDTIGVILMIVGAIGLAVTLAIFGGRRGRTVVHERDVL